MLFEESSVRVLAPHDALQNSSVATPNFDFGWLVAIVVQCGDTPPFRSNRVTVLGKVNNDRRLGNAGFRMRLRSNCFDFSLSTVLIVAKVCSSAMATSHRKADEPSRLIVGIDLLNAGSIKRSPSKYLPAGTIGAVSCSERSCPYQLPIRVVGPPRTPP